MECVISSDRPIENKRCEINMCIVFCCNKQGRHFDKTGYDSELTPYLSELLSDCPTRH